MLDTAIKKVYDTVSKFNMINKNDRVLVGFSGGADSLFLLLSLIELQEFIHFELSAAHLNHGIRGAEADSDELFVTEFCQKNNIKLYKKTMDIPWIASTNKTSEEVAGRNERYKFFKEICDDNNINKIAVAHNKNDSVETVILNLIRGASLTGLCGIKPVNDNIIRPIIANSRDEIELYLAKHNMAYCTDSTNLTDIYTRNKIRNNILQLMTEINPSVVETIFNNLNNLNNDESFINSYCKSLNCITKSEDEIIINKEIFDNEHIAIKNRIILTAISLLKGNTSNISSAHLSIVTDADKTGKIYALPDNIRVTISYNNIILSLNKKKYVDYSSVIEINRPFKYAENKYIICNYCDDAIFSEKNAVYIDADKLKTSSLIVRNRRDGDRFIPYGMKNEKKLKDFFINIKLPSDKRNETPIIIDDNEIVAVVPYRVSENYKITDTTKKILKIKINGEV